MNEIARILAITLSIRSLRYKNHVFFFPVGLLFISASSLVHEQVMSLVSSNAQIFSSNVQYEPGPEKNSNRQIRYRRSTCCMDRFIRKP